MKLNNIYTETIAHLEPTIQEYLVREAPHTRFSGGLPQELGFLDGSFVDLGFENLGLGKDEFKELLLAFSGTGVIVPGTALKLRYAGRLGLTVVEPAEPGLLELPRNWRQGVLVVNNDDLPSWIGERVRPEQMGKIDWNAYTHVNDGWLAH